MKKLRIPMVGGIACLAALAPVQVHAQDDTEALMAMGVDGLRGEIQTRYDRGLALSLDDTVVSADDNRFMWANEAKVQCGIALGFLKSSTKDRSSVSKCVLAARLMDVVSVPVVVSPPAPAPVPRSTICDNQVAGMVFFEFDSAEVPASASETLAFVRENAEPCGWTSISAVGHTDRSGSDNYNQRLSEDRAEAVANFLASMGIDRSMVSTSAVGETAPRVPTEDGVRNLQNRRVEITAK
ncbi:OmpA family protein [Altererythrobacter sp. ZODW24]|uniref:OmpA family protein n=1 Tax=Altererythrobacter sp. ZODW24 TaxID=2185142 RepID=UPI000DF8312E|nr:OmpA family protein [Altererythrobacter sp. ZODW24]